MMKKKVIVEEDLNVIETCRLAQECKSDIHRHFYGKSLLFRTIQAHIGYAEKCLLFDKTREVQMSSAHGPCVSFKGMTVWGTQYHENTPYEPTEFEMELDVTFEPDEDSDFRDLEKRLRLLVPFDLELDFSQEKFDLWAKSVHEKWSKEKEKKDREIFDKLLEQYPQWMNQNSGGSA